MKMISRRVIVASLMLCIVTCVWCQQPGTQTTEEQNSVNDQRRTAEMLEQAIMMIVSGDLNTLDMQLLKSMGYSTEDILALRERDLQNKMEKDQENLEKKRLLPKSTSVQSKIQETNMRNSKETSSNEGIDYEAYNKQAVYDYENLSNKSTEEIESDFDYGDTFYDETNPDKGHEEKEKTISNDGSLKSHVIFEIRRNNSATDSTTTDESKIPSTPLSSNQSEIKFNSSEASTDFNERDQSNSGNRQPVRPLFNYSTTFPTVFNSKHHSIKNDSFYKSNHRIVENHNPKIRHDASKLNFNFTEYSTKVSQAQNESNESFRKTEQPFRSLTDYSTAPPIAYLLSNLTKNATSNNSTSQKILTPINIENDSIMMNKSSEPKKVSEYEGLEWVEDDVYRVIPEALNYDINNEYDDSETIATEYHSTNSTMNKVMNDYFGYQGDLQPAENFTIENKNDTSNENTSLYQQIAQEHRQFQEQKAIEEIKQRVLALTGRTNLNTKSHQDQRQRLTMFSPICQIPRNTDAEAWLDPYSMNMHFQVNLTSRDHVVAARLRIYKLGQNNITSSNSSTSINDLEKENEDEQIIRISVYFYTKPLKKHRAKKTLIDSVVTFLSPQGSHLALDVRQALRFWRQTPRASHLTESIPRYGLVIQVEDQYGTQLKPALYIQQDSCNSNAENEDVKAYQRVPALFVQACSRYVRFENGEEVTYVNCKNNRNYRH